MKKLLYLVMLSLCVSFAACSDDDDNDDFRADPNFNPILGSWLGSGAEYYNTKRVFTADFKIEYYMRNTPESKWELVSTDEYLINSKKYKLKSTSQEIPYLVNTIAGRISLKLHENEDIYYAFFKE